VGAVRRSRLRRHPGVWALVRASRHADAGPDADADPLADPDGRVAVTDSLAVAERLAVADDEPDHDPDDLPRRDAKRVAGKPIAVAHLGAQQRRPGAMWRRRREGDEAASAAERMVRTQIESRGIKDLAVLGAMRRVPRHRFVPPHLSGSAYSDNALPIGGGQTISQPFIVALMTAAVDLPRWAEAHPGDKPRALDVGTGSGYQAAVLAEIGAQVVSIERDVDLARGAQQLLAELGYDVEVLVGDGSTGVPEHAPYAGIVVAAASPGVPPPLVEQLASDGRLVIPIGARSEQRLVVVERTEEGYSQRPLDAAVFVPLVGEHGFDDDSKRD
jgi:protein-L-isoaspartate(D-aspartate) O-methyltransferase